MAAAGRPARRVRARAAGRPARRGRMTHVVDAVGARLDA
jgi:hypothetical protein